MGDKTENKRVFYCLGNLHISPCCLLISFSYTPLAGIIRAAKQPGGSALEHLTKTLVRYADTDQMGRVHHAKYLEYFEIGRTEYMRARGHSYADCEKSGIFLVIVEAHIEYRKPVAYDMEITIRTRMGDFSHTQVTFEYNIENGAELLCTGWTRLACTDRDGKPRRIPDNLRKALRGDEQ
jgi:acyl-CoA thioester hydrolase